MDDKLPSLRQTLLRICCRSQDKESSPVVHVATKINICQASPRESAVSRSHAFQVSWTPVGGALDWQGDTILLFSKQEIILGKI